MRRADILGRFLLECGRLLLKSPQPPNKGLFLRAAYRACLQRDPDEAGFRHYKQALQSRATDWRGVLRSLVQSTEFKQLHGLAIHSLDALHQARTILVKHCLPPAQVILDLGGLSAGAPEGALLVMGYPYRPRQIIVVDLPPPEGAQGASGSQTLTSFCTADGVQVRYLYRSMTDLSPIPDGSVDMVWSGESIEHVAEEEADIVCREAYRVLGPGGSFCLDTPNAALTRLQSPQGLVHPEHKKEYYVGELRAKLENAGFQVLEAKGICPMPDSLRDGLFRPEEMVSNILVSEGPEQAYLFYLRAVKPATGAESGA